MHRNDARSARDDHPANSPGQAGPDLAGRRPAEPGYGAAGLTRIAWSKGLLTGLLLALLGIWGAIVPFVGPYFGYGLGFTGPWYFSLGRLWLDVLPGVAVLLGGIVLATSRNRAVAWPAAWLALAGGVWFVVGSQLSRLWTTSGDAAAGGVTGLVGHQVAQYMGYFFGLGAVITLLAAFAAGRLAVRGVRDVRAGLNART